VSRVRPPRAIGSSLRRHGRWASEARNGLFKKRPVAVPQAGGVYLDGGFGVGKTHLLASLWHAVPSPREKKA